MDFNHSNSLMIIQEDNVFEWVQDPLTDLPPLLMSDTNGLPPLPESLDDQFDGLTALSSALVPQEYYSIPPREELRFDDIDLDSFTWESNSFPESSSYDGRIVTDAIPLNIIADPNAIISSNGVPVDLVNVGSGSVRDGGGDEEGDMVSRTNGRSRSTEISFDDIRAYFYMPITRAAKEMNVGLTVLKKRCRELGIPRWPHRKMKSLKSLICNVQELGGGKCDEEMMRRELERLEEQRRRMEENPQIQLAETTKKLRQFCFKANYKKRRGMVQHPYLDHHHRAFVQ